LQNSTFLSVFDLGSLRDLPNVEALEDAGLLERVGDPDLTVDEFDEVLGLEPRGEEEG
jgi:segregation and condensation protein B